MKQFLVLVFLLALSNTVETSSDPGAWRYNDRCLDKYNGGEEFDTGYYVNKCVVYDGGWYTVGIACYTENKKRFEIGTTVDEEGFTYSCIKEGQNLRRSWRPIPSKTCEFTHNGRQYSYHNGEEFLYDQKFYHKCVIKNGDVSYLGTACYTGKTKILIGQSAQEGDFTYKCIKTETGGMRLRSSYDMRKKQCEIRDNTESTRKVDEGAEFNRGKYVYRCTIRDGNAASERVACRNGQGRRIDVGKSVMEDKYTYKCVNNNGRITLKISYPMKCHHIGNKVYDDGDEYVTKNGKFILRCIVGNGGWNTRVVACQTDGQKRRVNIGEARHDGSFKYTCEKTLHSVKRTKTYRPHI